MQRREGASGRNRPGGSSRPIGRALKRTIDVVGALLGLIVLSPIMAAAALLVAIRLGRPVLFRHERPGLGGVPFAMIKFRTMTDERGPDGQLLGDDLRRHPFGNKLRRTSVDELPTLLNVLRGEMSLVGPRPLMMEYLPRYSPEQRRRHDVKPGMTGLAQVRGRNASTWDDRFANDLEYVDGWGLRLDVQILVATVRTVVSGGADALDDEAPEEFMGSDPRSVAA